MTEQEIKAEIEHTLRGNTHHGRLGLQMTLIDGGQSTGIPNIGIIGTLLPKK
ncbi:hypothetical protein ES707_06461 [subsurface metagenome]